MLSEPALITSKDGSNAERKALLAEQSVTTVARAEGPDGALLGEVSNAGVLRVARPRHVLDASAVGLNGKGHTDRVDARHEETIVAKNLENGSAHTSHDAHVDADVGRVGDLHTDLGDVRADGSHGEWDDIHRATNHATIEELGEALLHDTRVDPVIGWASVGLLLRADEGKLLDTRNIL